MEDMARVQIDQPINQLVDQRLENGATDRRAQCLRVVMYYLLSYLRKVDLRRNARDILESHVRRTQTPCRSICPQE